MVPELRKLLLAELQEEVSDAGSKYAGDGSPLKDALWDVVEATKRKFIFIIDEWDAPYRLAPDNTNAQDTYAEWLRGLFKDATFTPEVIAGAYMTGILPIRNTTTSPQFPTFGSTQWLPPLLTLPTWDSPKTR